MASITHQTIGLPGFVVRPTTIADISDIVAVFNASSMDTIGTQITAAHWQKRHWQEQGIRLERDTLAVTTAAGMIVGYVELSSDLPYVVHWVRGAVHPDYRNRGIGTFLLGWAEEQARMLIPQAPQRARVVLHCDLFDRNQPGKALLLSQGFSQVRHFIHLRIKLDSPPPEPAWPEGIQVRPLMAEDWPAVGPALMEAFQDHWGQLDYLGADEPEDDPDTEEANAESYDKDYFNTPGLCFVALAGDEVIGSCLCNAKTIEFPQAGKLGSLSIRRSWRRQGIGLALTLHALGEFYRRGVYEVVTDTDGNSLTGANFLYQKAGMAIFRQEEVYEKEIRAGKDLLKRSLE